MSSANTRRRQAAGTPVGGQFATEARTEPDVDLAAGPTHYPTSAGRPEGDTYQFPAGVPRIEALTAYDDEQGTYTIGDDMHVAMRSSGRFWIDRARDVLGPLRAAGLRGDLEARWEGANEMSSSRTGEWSAWTTLPSGTHLSIDARDEDWPGHGTGISITTWGVNHTAAAHTERPEAIAGALREALTFAAYTRAARTLIENRAALGRGAEASWAYSANGVPVLRFERHLSSGSDRASVLLEPDGPVVRVAPVKAPPESVNVPVDMASEQGAASLGRALGFTGRSPHVARAARYWLAKVAAAPESDADLAWLKAGRA